MTPERIVQAISKWTYDLSDEIRAQDQIEGALKSDGINFDREVRLSGEDRIDFLCESGVGIEVKLKGQARAIFRQIQRYAASSRVQQIMLVTNRTMGMPKTVCGKRVVVMSLGRTLL